MKYRKFGSLDWQVSALGFGLERLPSNEVEAVNMLRHAIDGGVNFIDAGSALKDSPQLSQTLQKALKEGYRRKVKLSAALPPDNINSRDDFDRALDDILNQINMDSIDFLTLGGLNRFSWARLEEQGVLKWVESGIKNRKIRYTGFYFHDQYQFLREIIEAYDGWNYCQFQYSFMDIDHHPGVSGLAYAVEQGLGVVVVKPLLGGRLTKEPPESVARVWSAAEIKRSPAEWGLRWVWNHADVSTVVSDMPSLEELKVDLALADAAEADSFSVAEELVIGKVRDAYRNLKPVPCTACRGCMPCPLDIDVPRIFEIYNDATMYDDFETARSLYKLERHDIDACNECGRCASACGLKIPILEWLKKVRIALVE